MEGRNSAKTHLAFLGNLQDYHVRKWLPALAEQGLQVTAFTFHVPDAALPGVAVEPLRPWRGRPPERLRWFDFWQSARRVRARIDAAGADVLMGSYATHYGWLGARTGFRPYVLQTWTFDVSLFPFQGRRRFYYGPVVRRSLRAADLVTTDGPALAELVRERHGLAAERVVPVRWGIRLKDYAATPELRADARRRWQLPAEAPVVVSARGVKAVYQPEVVLPALRRLLDARPDAHVLVLTLGHERPAAVQAHLDALAAHPRARVLDAFLPTDTVRTVWAAADVLVSCPARDGISEAILEGMYAGAIPVVSDIPSNRSFLREREQAFFVPEASADALLRVLHDVLGHLPEHQARLVAANRAWVEREASVEATARQVAGLVRHLAQS